MIIETIDKNSGAILFKKDKESLSLDSAVKRIDALEKKITTLEKKLKALEKDSTK